MLNKVLENQPWLQNKYIEFSFILIPPFACLSLIYLFPNYFISNKDLNDYSWVVLILLIDVAHVYSTLYRTYFSKQMQVQNKTLLYAIPLISFLISVIIYTISSIWFWRIMAYIAVFHFIRQQYGFMRLYSRNENLNKHQILLDKIIIYTATLYPIIYWHFCDNRVFSWFVEGDFVTTHNYFILKSSTVVYFFVLIAFVLNYCYLFFKNRSINIPKLLIIFGTIISWYFGIVYFNGDITFTLLNVVSHGVPYMALIWLVGKKEHNPKNSYFVNKKVFSRFGIILFIAIIFFLAYFEEGLWDALVWNEHKRIFHIFSQPFLNPSHQQLSFIVPLLALPQITHYVIDGFIWKIKSQSIQSR